MRCLLVQQISQSRCEYQASYFREVADNGYRWDYTSLQNVDEGNEENEENEFKEVKAAIDTLRERVGKSASKYTWFVVEVVWLRIECV